ncbi:SDR family NAD(P)-dependent oxidoreductase [Nocardiopsis flavescens]|uniref:3-oxoacyl-[acyl-carrier protein] reductase n=1 Tax=Nocardiopsis flavescens TaxID=758803 RepID=A0A1M6ICW3_9ACTN|nr:glucose 1-dehydrogenase [Nocardiopsis flavescens]SHJ32243.1 3-oxoacyl-[acyl-carrier protein] reductase [Nocardiopsis flavescens]
MTDLTGKTALVTGSSRGIGRGIALRYASLGADVVINHAGDGENARNTVAEIEEAGGRAIAVRADVSLPPDLDRLLSAALGAFGRLDIVVANAGKEIIDQPVLDVTEEEFDDLFAVNTKGAFFTLQKAAALLSDGGRLIYIGSSTTASPHPGVGLYSSSKAAVAWLVRVLALELGPRDITVNTILPTATAGAGVFSSVTEGDEFHQGNAAFRPLGGRGGTPDDVADAAEYLAGNLASWVSGQSLLVAGGAIQ